MGFKSEGRVGHRGKERGQMRLQSLDRGAAEQRVEQREPQTAPGHRRVAALRFGHSELLEHEGEVDSHVAARARQSDAAAHLPSHVVVLVLHRLGQRGEQRLRVRGDLVRVRVRVRVTVRVRVGISVRMRVGVRVRVPPAPRATAGRAACWSRAAAPSRSSRRVRRAAAAVSGAAVPPQAPPRPRAAARRTGCP